MRLSVIVVNWNSRRDLDACLRSLEQQSYPDLQVIVVDNGSTDGSVELVHERYSAVTLLATGENLGFAEGCNRGIALSDGPWVCMLNNDAVAEPGWAAAMAEAAAAGDDRLGMLQSLMVYLTEPDTVNSAGIALRPNGDGIDRGDRQPRARYLCSEEIFCPTAGAAAYRRSMLERIRLADGYFDSKHFMYYEDLDLGWRARLAGYRAWLVPEALVRHRWHGSAHRHGDSWVAIKARTNRLRTLVKNGSWPLLLRALPKSALDVGQLWWAGGGHTVRLAGQAVADAWRDRERVGAMTAVSPRAVERRWATARRGNR